MDRTEALQENGENGLSIWEIPVLVIQEESPLG